MKYFKLVCQDDEFQTHELCIHADNSAFKFEVTSEHALRAAQFRGPDWGLLYDSMGVEEAPKCLKPKHKGFRHELIQNFTYH